MNNFIIKAHKQNTKEKKILNDPYSFIRRINEKKNESNLLIIATILKKLRTEKHLTIADLAKDICSISYLSKLENGQIFANEQTIGLLFDRLGVPFKTFSSQNKKIDLHKLIFAYATYDIDTLSRMYNETLEMSLNIATPIIKCFYFIAVNDFDNAIKEIKDLEPVKETLGHYESSIYLFSLIEYYIKKYDFNHAYNYIKLFEMIDSVDDFLKLLFLETKIKASYNLKKYVMLAESTNEFKQMNYLIYPRIRKMEVDLIHKLYLFSEYPNKVLDELDKYDENLLNKVEIRCLYYYKTLIKLQITDPYIIYDDMLKNQEYFKDERIFGLFGLVVLLVDLKECYKKLISLSNELAFDEANNIHQKFVCFVLMYGSKADDSDLLLYIKNEIINPNITEKYRIYDEVYIDIYLKLLESISRYKEAFLFIRNYKENLLKISKY